MSTTGASRSGHTYSHFLLAHFVSVASRQSAAASPSYSTRPASIESKSRSYGFVNRCALLDRGAVVHFPWPPHRSFSSLHAPVDGFAFREPSLRTELFDRNTRTTGKRRHDEHREGPLPSLHAAAQGKSRSTQWRRPSWRGRCSLEVDVRETVATLYSPGSEGPSEAKSETLSGACSSHRRPRHRRRMRPPRL